ncbi:ABC transporter substrate-binding protein [Amycolatopsis mediterranei S699]|uniref:ABC transport system substrate-binding protein n=3 Tax=Amycolatopsis mediterranei TaxID=33910 RepID=A0A0H3CWW7_AMYMU|nr:MCE family protein [Amycolatopsis mediterranei]AAS07743.1 putative secreted protein [Amycolatopsis mediterranei S699]ADJ42424.1 ABC transport system substrate-binding protein [Amycolatopsis mediterranei U32]AEK39110.1 ABC transporter substrate-binding protein [Amycolatopsis mediterranei S699]AFO74138.1 ABC transporter substrate-binding protein [Amycolatopsis mediterranei S699]AGT81267.1 ABC transporter substrate-binding protein [Amycolatopsis mediterranei RB]
MRTLRRRLLGLLLIAVMVGGVALSIALYDKAFTPVVTVRLQADKIGNQLIKQSDVKVRGLIVGSVQDIVATDHGAELTLALQPESAKLIPENVSARFLPKTLFGERFVSLEIPKDPSAKTIADGDVIPQDRTSSAIELDQAFEHLMPVLQAVQPQKLSATLTAISTALQGRGDQLGDTLSQLGTYIGELNPHEPELQHNLKALAEFSDHLKDAAPDLVQSLDNLSTTTRTVVDERQNLSNLYGSLTQASVDLQTFLQNNKDNIISLVDTARPTAELLAKYAPEYPCVISQMAKNVPLIDQALGKGTNQPGLHATIEIIVPRAPYQAGKEEPRFDDKRGPRCYDIKDIPKPFPSEPPDGAFKDGTLHQAAPKSVGEGLNPAKFKADSAGNGGSGGDLAYSTAEQGFLADLLGPQLGMSAADVPGWSSLLVGPLYRGAEVTVK